MNNKARNLDCLYNIYLFGVLMARMTDREATAEYGPEIWGTECIDHSEWCDQHKAEARSTWVDGSPIMAIDTPPF